LIGLIIKLIKNNYYYFIYELYIHKSSVTFYLNIIRQTVLLLHMFTLKSLLLDGWLLRVCLY